MPKITCDLERNDRLDVSIYMFRVDGKTILGLTDQSGEAAAKRLLTICEANAETLLALVTASDQARERNFELMRTGGQGKDWPAFGKLERFREKLLKEANIKNT